MNTLRRLAATLLLGVPFASASASEHLQLVERATTDVTVDVGAKGDSPGDMLTFSNPIYDAANLKQVGSDQGYCIRILAARSWECSFSLLLETGQLNIMGAYLDGKDSSMSVTGGTGAYVGARGSLLLRARDAKGHIFDFGFDLL